MSKFGDGTVAAMESGPWDYSAAQKALGADKLGVAVYPTIKIGDKEVQQKPSLVSNSTQSTKHLLVLIQNVSQQATNSQATSQVQIHKNNNLKHVTSCQQTKKSKNLTL